MNDFVGTKRCDKIAVRRRNRSDHMGTYSASQLYGKAPNRAGPAMDQYPLPFRKAGPLDERLPAVRAEIGTTAA